MHANRPDFPILHEVVNGFNLVYLDNAATSQKPSAVLKVLNEYYESYNSNVHRGVRYLSAKATDAYEEARTKVANFVNAMGCKEIVFTRYATEAVNLQIVAKKTGAVLKYVGLTKEEVPDLDQFKGLLSKKTKLVVAHHISNVLGSVLPIDEIMVWSHNVGAKVLVDACQIVPHMVVDVQKLDVDFLVASSQRFEAGTPAIGEAVGLGAAIDYLSSIDMQWIHNYEKELSNYLYYCFSSIPNLHIHGPAPSETIHRAALCSFNVENIHPTDIAMILDEQHGVAIRSGHHWAQPLHRALGVNSSARASLYFYKTKEEVDVFIQAQKDTIYFFASSVSYLHFVLALPLAIMSSPFACKCELLAKYI
ncbi:hypothetical protein OPV22_012903 [Ensete ventricosum]|uniref:cysteine desulfurase n=1 Tax=Ensete ventricosum TaxID=4639 RepID=A0AAV8QU97_ENSVE|nr:hypothetical protein OPV22_012903 [Ensete ventricosum]